jgi:MOSC domain-containing protein YiiM
MLKGDAMTTNDLETHAAVAPNVVSVQVGRVAPLGTNGVASGFVKRQVTGPVRVGKLNLDGDQQADLRVHGGPDKAVYAYAAANYPLWAQDFPEHAALLTPGVFGENLTVAGLVEGGIYAGDVHAIGSARLQVCQPRQPCFKLGLRFDDKRLPRAMVRSGRSGWYYRVIEEGIVSAGDTLRVVERPNPDLPLTRLIDIVYRGQTSAQELARIAVARGVADWLRLAARQAVKSE